MKFYGQWNPPVDEVLYRNYFPDKTDGFFVECGALDGITHSCCLFFEQRGWKGINVEPADINFKVMEANRPKTINVQAALGNHDGRTIFSKSMKGDICGGGSVEWHPKFQAKVANAGYEFVESDVQILTYKTLTRRHNVKKVNLFVLDVEGYELKVIDGMTGSRHLPDVVCIEYPLVGLKSVRAAFIQIGYRFDFFSFNNAFFAMPFIPTKKHWFGKSEHIFAY